MYVYFVNSIVINNIHYYIIITLLLLLVFNTVNKIDLIIIYKNLFGACSKKVKSYRTIRM